MHEGMETDGKNVPESGRHQGEWKFNSGKRVRAVAARMFKEARKEEFQEYVKRICKHSNQVRVREVEKN